MSLENYKKAREIWLEIKNIAEKIVRPEASYLEICETIEKEIVAKNAKPAFPVNISVNEIAAHYTASIDDKNKIASKDVVKLDFGVMYGNVIYDGAITFDFSKEYEEMIKVAEKAVKEGVKNCKPGKKVWEISEAIASVVEASEFNLVRNLSGHKIEANKLHAGISIPNYRNKISYELKEGDLIAIEVFLTNGSGWVKDSKPVEIFEFKQRKPVRDAHARKILDLAEKEFSKLPFAKRWLKMSKSIVDLAINKLVELDALHAFPVLKEISNGIVVQAEQTVYVS